MENTKQKYVVEIEPIEYKTNADYSIEQGYDKRYFYRLISIFNFSKQADRIIDAHSNYQKSKLHLFKSGYLNGEYPSLKHLVEKNSIIIKVTAKKNGKVKSQFNELKFSNELIDIFTKYSTLGLYKIKLMDYKRLRDEGKKSLLMLEHGEEYVSPEEFKNVKTLIQATSNALRLLENQGNNNLTNQMLSFLKSNITIKREFYEYEIVTDTIYNIPEFNKFELEELEMLNADMAHRLEKMSSKDNKNTKTSNSDGQEM